MIKRIALLLLFCPVIAISAPAPTGTTGTFTDGQNVTVQGSGFGTKSPVAPAKYDPIDGMYTNIVNNATVPRNATETASGTYPWNEPGGSEGVAPVFNTTDHRGKRSTSYSNKGNLTDGGAATVGGWHVPNCPTTGIVYLSFWVKHHFVFYNNYLPPDYAEPDTQNNSNSGKFWRINNDILGEDSDTYILQVGPSDGAQFDFYDGTYRINDYSGPVLTRAEIGNWTRLETAVNNGASTRTVAIWKNGVASGSGSTSDVSPKICTIATMGADWSNYTGTTPQMDYGEIYVDSTLARVEICAGSTWTARGHCEIQIPNTTWGDTNLQIQVNQGSFADSSSAYLYVVDAAGATGRLSAQVTFGAGGGADATAPTVTAAAINGTTATITFSETVVTTGYDASDFNLDCPTAGTNISLTSPSGSGSSRTFTIATTIPYGDTCNIDYVGSTDDIEDSAGNDLVTFSDHAVTNNTPGQGVVARAECSSPPAGTVFCEDFEGTTPKANFDDYDGNSDSENLIVTDNGPSEDGSNKVIRLRVPAGEGVSDLLKVLTSTHDKLYARWYFKYETGFNFAAPNHGGGLAAGDRGYVGQSGARPTGADFAGFYLQYHESTSSLYPTKPYTYSYYRGMYQDCSNPASDCYGDSLPCVFDSGASYCTKAAERPQYTLPTLVAGQWYRYDQMVDMGSASADGTGATGRITQWIDGAMISDNTGLWLRTNTSLKLENLWLSLYHHDGTHSTVGEMIDNVVVSTQSLLDEEEPPATTAAVVGAFLSGSKLIK